jgi:hypothetical protein
MGSAGEKGGVRVKRLFRTWVTFCLCRSYRVCVNGCRPNDAPTMTRRNGTPKSAGCLFNRRWRGDLFNGLEANVGIGADVVENKFVDQCITALSLRFETINLRRGLACVSSRSHGMTGRPSVVSPHSVSCIKSQWSCASKHPHYKFVYR